MSRAPTLVWQRDDGLVAARLRPRAPLPPVAVAALLVAGATLVAVVSTVSGSAAVVVGLVTVGAGLVRPQETRAPRTAWMVPPALRTLEYVVAVAAGAAVAGVGGTAAAFAYVLAVGYHHYDVVYRVRQHGLGPAAAVTALLGGWELRTAAVLVAWELGSAAEVLAALSIWCGGIAVVESVASWRRVSRGATSPGAEAEEEIVE